MTIAKQSVTFRFCMVGAGNPARKDTFMKRLYLIPVALCLLSINALAQENSPDSLPLLVGIWKGEIAGDFTKAENPNAFIPLQVNLWEKISVEFSEVSVILTVGKISYKSALRTKGLKSRIGFTVELFGYPANFFGMRKVTGKKDEIAGMFRIPDLDCDGRWQAKKISSSE